MTVHEADWYDRVMVEDGSPALLPLEESGWEPLYREAASWIGREEHVVDLGCGTARFAHALADREHYATYTGIDFSRAALEQAVVYLADIIPVDRLDLRLADLRTFTPDPARPGNTVYVCTEVLEHLADDVDLVHRIPPGHRLIFSLPNYDSEAHLRTIRNAGEIWDRYQHIIQIRRWSLVELGGPRTSVHLVDSVRRGDSW